MAILSTENRTVSRLLLVVFMFGSDAWAQASFVQPLPIPAPPMHMFIKGKLAVDCGFAFQNPAFNANCGLVKSSLEEGWPDSSHKNLTEVGWRLLIVPGVDGNYLVDIKTKVTVIVPPLQMPMIVQKTGSVRIDTGEKMAIEIYGLMDQTIEIAKAIKVEAVPIGPPTFFPIPRQQSPPKPPPAQSTKNPVKASLESAPPPSGAVRG